MHQLYLCCLVEGLYGQWSAWEDCSATCGRCSSKTRTRTCHSPFVKPEAWEVDVCILSFIVNNLASFLQNVKRMSAMKLSFLSSKFGDKFSNNAQFA